VAESGKTSIPADLHGIDRLLNVGEFRAYLTKPVERDMLRFRGKRRNGRAKGVTYAGRRFVRLDHGR